VSSSTSSSTFSSCRTSRSGASESPCSRGSARPSVSPALPRCLPRRQSRLEPEIPPTQEKSARLGLPGRRLALGGCQAAATSHRGLHAEHGHLIPREPAYSRRICSASSCASCVLPYCSVLFRGLGTERRARGRGTSTTVRCRLSADEMERGVRELRAALADEDVPLDVLPGGDRVGGARAVG
jgi:hypothetical protein